MKIVTRQYNMQVAKTENRPLTTTWKNARMIRNHSIRACAKEILNVNRGIDVVKVNLIGSPSTGKTTLAKTLAHLIHEEADSPYIIKVFSRAELLDMENTLAKLQPLNHVMIFDDVSWLQAGANKNKIDQVQKTFTEIRHLPGGQDIKVIIIFNFHYQMGMPKHLRQAHFFGFTDMGSSETENIQKMVGLNNMYKVGEFRNVAYEYGSSYKAATEEKPEQLPTFSYKISKLGRFVYTYRQPFAPALWWNNNSLRHIVFPAREWIQPICYACTGIDSKAEEEFGDALTFKEIANTVYNESKVKSALQVLFFIQGQNTFSRPVLRCIKWIEREWKLRKYNYAEIMKLYDLSETPNSTTRMPTIDEFLKEKESISGLDLPDHSPSP